jgi:hypothetical protein
LKIQDHPGKRTFISTDAGYRLEVHPPREWIEATLDAGDELRIAELRLRSDDPEGKAAALARVLGLEADGPAVTIGESVVSFEDGGPEGRPELVGEALA